MTLTMPDDIKKAIVVAINSLQIAQGRGSFNFQESAQIYPHVQLLVKFIEASEKEKAGQDEMKD